MFRSLIAWTVLATAFAALGLQTTSANAQNVGEQMAAKAEAAVEKLKQTCSSDINNFCSKVTPGEGRLALCMMAHEDKISDTCYSAILDVADAIELGLSNVWRAADVCEEDIDKHCANVSTGEGRIAQCLIDNKAKLASTCRAEMAGIEARLKN